MGEVELEEKVLVIRRIRVVLRLQARPELRETIDRVFKVFPSRCPVYRTLLPAIQFQIELELLPESG